MLTHFVLKKKILSFSLSAVPHVLVNILNKIVKAKLKKPKKTC